MKDKYTKWFRSLSIDFDVKYSYFIMTVYNTSIIIGGLIFSLYGFTLASFFPKYDLLFALQESLWGMCLYGLSTYIVESV